MDRQNWMSALERGIADVDPMETPERTRGRGPTLTLVTRAVRTAAVGRFGGRLKLEEAQLANLHARVELDRHGCRIRELQGDVP